MSETSKAHKEKSPRNLAFAIITISTSRYQESKASKHISDESGDLIAKMLQKHGHTVVSRELISDDKAMIRRTALKALKSSRIDAIITSGGTGITPSDLTMEAMKPLLEKVLPGFGEIFRWLSYQSVGSAAVMTRAIAGVTRGKAIFCLPGSPQAVKLCLEKLILPEAGHIILHARGT
jgi:molybdenum cofactor biosynthesis protein B